MLQTLYDRYRTLRFIARHPVSAGRRWAALLGYARWQLGKRLGLIRGPVRTRFVNASQLLVYERFSDSVGVLYTGLPEFWEMGFTMHLLRAGDLFVDCGANVGTYTVAAAAGSGASCIAIEPVPATYAALLDNVALNELGNQVTCLNLAVGNAPGTLLMTATQDTGNHVLAENEVGGAIEVPSRTLDEVLDGRSPTLIKIDVEGYESTVLDGAERTLASTDLLAVILELNGSGERFGIPDRLLHERMLALGFETFFYSAVTRTLTSLERRQSRLGNTVYVRHEARVRERLRTAQAFSIRGKSF